MRILHKLFQKICSDSQITILIQIQYTRFH